MLCLLAPFCKKQVSCLFKMLLQKTSFTVFLLMAAVVHTVRNIENQNSQILTAFCRRVLKILFALQKRGKVEAFCCECNSLYLKNYYNSIQKEYLCLAILFSFVSKVVYNIKISKDANSQILVNSICQVLTIDHVQKGRILKLPCFEHNEFHLFSFSVFFFMQTVQKFLLYIFIWICNYINYKFESKHGQIVIVLCL